MLLTSSAYFVFLIAIFFLYWPLTRVRAASLAIILFANYFFYAKWDLSYLALIPIASCIDFCIGLGLGSVHSQGIRRLLLTLSIVMNLGMIAVFKYMPFLLSNYANITGQTVSAWQWVFPIGVSFYAFQALTYTIDVYRRDAKPVKSLLSYLAAVSFFPTTLAGPITRVATLAPQMDKRRILDPADGGRALFLIGIGLMKKFLIADYLGNNLVDRVFDFPKLYSGFEVLVAVYAYALQLYYDFSGYTDIALGSALLLSIKLPVNFNQPYMAENIADFWRRWHISLSNWLRDYLYFSLPGKRSRILVYPNLILTMVLGGFWHGPSWNFVIWGALHGFGLAMAHALQRRRGKREQPAPAWLRFVKIFATVQFVCFAWIFFRSPNLGIAGQVLSQIGSLTMSNGNISSALALVLFIAAAAHYLPKRWYDWSLNLYIRAPFYVQGAAMALLVLAIQYIGTTGAVPFIYTKF